jgi:hypothetical protein
LRATRGKNFIKIVVDLSTLTALTGASSCRGHIPHAAAVEAERRRNPRTQTRTSNKRIIPQKRKQRKEEKKTRRHAPRQSS